MIDALIGIVIYAIWVFLGLVVSVLTVCGIFLAIAVRNANKLMWDLPWLKWLTLDEIVEMGFSRFWSEFFLPLFYKKGYLEIRISSDCPKEKMRLIEFIGFNSYTVQFHEFKLTKRSGRKKPKPWKLPAIFEWRPVSA
ncbi:MAG: hypothetical protein WC814_01835 [Candidatus Paceibacterota bacterium]|jgi:hypothetical protein